MKAHIQVVGMRTPVTEGYVFNTCNNNPANWESDLSPFVIGPCKLYQHDGAMLEAARFENAWQFAKLFASYADATNQPTPSYWEWAKAGWTNPKPIRFPMGRGARPLCSMWDGQRLNYIQARKKIYGPLYIEAIKNSAGYKKLVEVCETYDLVVLRDFDGYDHEKQSFSLSDVLNNPRKKAGHSFFLKMFLTGDEALKQLDLRS